MKTTDNEKEIKEAFEKYVKKRGGAYRLIDGLAAFKAGVAYGTESAKKDIEKLKDEKLQTNLTYLDLAVYMFKAIKKLQAKLDQVKHICQVALEGFECDNGKRFEEILAEIEGEK